MVVNESLFFIHSFLNRDFESIMMDPDFYYIVTMAPEPRERINREKHSKPK